MAKALPTLKTAASIPLSQGRINGDQLTLMAGPCAVEDRGLLLEIAGVLKRAGVSILRGGAFKPRTFADSFQGLGETGLKYLREAADTNGMAFVTEALDTRHVELVSQYADILQVGSRNMHNFALLREIGRAGKPVLLKRGMGATLEEFIGAATYILGEGNDKIIFCERGIRTFSETSRFTLDLAVIRRLKEHIPGCLVIVDPSHAAGDDALVPDLARAAVAAGVDGLLIETHTRPEEALCDKDQAILPSSLEELAVELRALYSLVRGHSIVA